MPADLTNPFNPSCCDGGECSTSKESAQPCGCDMGAPVPHFCSQHELTPIKDNVRWLLKRVNLTDFTEAEHEIFQRTYRWTKS